MKLWKPAKWFCVLTFGLLIVIAPSLSYAHLVRITGCRGANDCIITGSPPGHIKKDPNSGVLMAWNEKQNVKLRSNLPVDRVFDPSAPFVERTSDGFVIKAGTVVSSHYIQWDPGRGSESSVRALIHADSQIFAFITDDQKLFETDTAIGRTGLNYNDFKNRSLENEDKTAFQGKGVKINWRATSPGDWTRLITAYSPTAASQAKNETHTIVIDGSKHSGGTCYVIRMKSGGVRQVEGKLHGRRVTIQEGDNVQGGAASGYVGTGRDGFRASGTIGSIELFNPQAAEVFVDGKPYQPVSHTIVIDGENNPARTCYKISVSGLIRKAEGQLEGRRVTIDSNDVVCGGNARGAVTTGKDGFRVTGEIRSIELFNPEGASVFVDGRPYPLEK